jgi:uncharacterized protein
MANSAILFMLVPPVRRLAAVDNATVDRTGSGWQRSRSSPTHAGNFVTRTIYHELAALGPPVVTVHGNQDDAELRALLPETRVVDVAGIRIGLIHDAGPAKGRLNRMRRRFADCDAVVFGHSHIPLYDTDDDGFQIFNPASPTDRRRQPEHTMGLAEVGQRRIVFTILAAR